jgi:hypothetical protein
MTFLIFCLLLLSLAVASGNMTETLETEDSITVCPIFWQNTMYISTPTVRSWWSQWGVMAASHCNSWEGDDGLVLCQQQCYGYDRTHSCHVNFGFCWNCHNGYLQQAAVELSLQLTHSCVFLLPILPLDVCGYRMKTLAAYTAKPAIVASMAGLVSTLPLSPPDTHESWCTVSDIQIAFCFIPYVTMLQ